MANKNIDVNSFLGGGNRGHNSNRDQRPMNAGNDPNAYTAMFAQMAYNMCRENIASVLSEQPVTMPHPPTFTRSGLAPVDHKGHGCTIPSPLANDKKNGGNGKKNP